MPAENGVSPEAVAALPEPAVGVEYPSGEAAKLAVFRAFLAQQAEPACRGNWHRHSIACRLHADATPSSVGKGSCCTFMYKYEAIELGEDPVKITFANLVHSCPEGVRKARFRSQELDLGQNYVRLKVFTAELRYQSQQKEQPVQLEPARENKDGVGGAKAATSSSASQVDKAREPKPLGVGTPSKDPKPSTATQDKDDKLVAADAANPSTSSAPQVDTAGKSASVESGNSATNSTATITVGAAPPQADPAAPRAATLPPPGAAGPSLPAGGRAAAAAAAQPASSPDSEPVEHPGSRASEDPPPYSVQPVTENKDEPPRKRARLTPPTGFPSGVSDAFGSLLGLIDARRRTRGAGSSLASLQGHHATSNDRQVVFRDKKTSQRDVQVGKISLFDAGTSKPVGEAPVSQGIPLGPRSSFRRHAQQQQQQQVMQPPPPPPPPMASLLAAHGFDAQQRLSVELALREIGIRSMQDLITFVLLEDETVEAMARHLGTFNIPWAGNALFPSLELAVGSLLAQMREETRAIRWS
ncbi:hypothetical protein C6P46_004357 [Rhodotorula mucilaginosa]|uniref:Uncharacterized protein n=1 Tax=Rhodotorula mucilaginosa TaxID=5537 RepID=A0A9P6W9E2_RHOMI|nr:hypothetical protein C6P46_004357 [Rhodotorula mucilaginosa]TKA55004.1 hypothetical protein B0A53_02477 [Rhodotorula sp. CCFEE 5036]